MILKTMNIKNVTTPFRCVSILFIIIISNHSTQCQKLIFERHDIETNFDGIKTVKIIDYR